MRLSLGQGIAAKAGLIGLHVLLHLGETSMAGDRGESRWSRLTREKALSPIV